MRERLWGRGIFYFFIGSLLFTPWEVLPLVVGVYMMGLGVLTMVWAACKRLAILQLACSPLWLSLCAQVVARMTSSKLDALRKAVGEDADPEQLRKIFRTYDKDGSGAIERSEFAHVRAAAAAAAVPPLALSRAHAHARVITLPPACGPNGSGVCVAGRADGEGAGRVHELERAGCGSGSHGPRALGRNSVRAVPALVRAGPGHPPRVLRIAVLCARSGGRAERAESCERGCGATCPYAGVLVV